MRIVAFNNLPFEHDKSSQTLWSWWTDAGMYGEGPGESLANT